MNDDAMSGFLLPLIITLAVQVQVSLVVFTPPILAPVAQGDVGVSAAAVGLVTALIYVSSVPSALFSSKVISHLGPIRVSQLCILFFSCGMAMMAV
ncbi:MAG: MFS transporter, partial [Burkholderiales bacterium]|nr:MFS transporter [Burkholderiales bacterium]